MDETRNSSGNARARWRSGLVATAAVLLAGCADAGDSRLADGARNAGAFSSVDMAIPSSVLGDILSGRVAQDSRDYVAALAFYQDALRRSPDSAELGSRVLALAVTEGRFDIAAPLAARLAAANPDGAGLAQLVETVEQVKAGRWADALAAAKHLPREGFYRFAGTFARAWTLAATADKGPEAAAEFDEFGQAETLAGLKALQMALVEDLTGDAGN